MEIGNRLAEPNPAGRPACNPCEQLVCRRTFHHADQLGRKIRLQRLPTFLGPSTKFSVHVIWKVSDQHVWHGLHNVSVPSQSQALESAWGHRGLTGLADAVDNDGS